MLALAIVLSVLVLLALLRFGVIIEYSGDGFNLWVKAGFLRFKLLDKEKKEKKKKPKKKKDKKDKKKSQTSLMPGSFSEFMNMLKAVKNTLGRLRRRLLIKRLTLHYTSAGDNPASTAIKYGAANAAFNTIVPFLERHFRIKRTDLMTSFDFISNEQRIYAKIIISIAVWEVFYVVFALFPILTASMKSKPGKKAGSGRTDINDRKDGNDDGKSAN